MLIVYHSTLKPRSRELRKHMTDAERHLWLYLRKKKVLDIQFYRQRPIGPYIADFYAPSVRLVIEVDGRGHAEKNQILYDSIRTKYFQSLDLT